MFGLPSGFAPLAWMYDVPLIVLVGEIAQRDAAPHGQRALQRRCRPSVLPRRQRPSTLGHELLEAVGVDTLRLHVELVAMRAGEQDLVLAVPVRQRLAQARHVHLQRLVRGGGRRLAPQLLDQLVGAQRLVRVDQQHRQQRLLLAAADSDHAAFIDDFERTLADEGTIIVKLWMHISAQEQLKRFEARAGDPLKSWKLTDEDWRNREKRPQYVEAVEEMLERTDRPCAPWRVIAAESKRFARVETMRVVIEEIERGMRRVGQEPPPPP